MPKRQNLIAIPAVLALFAAVLVSPNVLAQSPAPWPAGALDRAIASCRSAFLDTASRDLIKREKIPPNQIPSNFRDQLAVAIAPYLNSCNCSLGLVSTEFPHEAFTRGDPLVAERMKQLVAPGNRCEIK